MALIKGTTEDGTKVSVKRLKGPMYSPASWKVKVDGKRVGVQRVSLYRDGGSLRIETDAGVILDTRRRLTNPQPPTLEGETIYGKGMQPELRTTQRTLPGRADG